MTKLWSKRLLVAVQSGRGHICSTKPFLHKMVCEISGWRFLKFSFMRVFTVLHRPSGIYCQVASSNFTFIYDRSFESSLLVSY